ncbi:MAG: acyl--CoA ligase, partial [Acidobacteriota bacterium]|nr:acyl--CoA ligase [Acidobacteriota bacterium]
MTSELPQITGPSQDVPLNLGQLLKQHVDAAPEKHFLFSEADGRRFTFAEFDGAVNRACRMLTSTGVGQGDVVSLLLPNSLEYIIAYFACWKLGAIAGPVNCLLKADEVAFVISDSDAKVLLVHSDFAATIDSIRNEVPNLRTVIPFDDEASTTSDFDGESGRGSSTNLSLSDINLDSEAIIIYTSGTTGKPKGCLLTHGNLIANARQISQWLGFTRDDSLLTVMPLFHMNAVSVTTLSALYAGGSTIIGPKFSASRFWQIVSDYEVTSFGSVATMLSMLLSAYPEGVPKGLKTDQLRFAMCGSAPVPTEVLQRFEETFDCLVIEGYGLSESTCRSTFNPPDQRRRPGSCGMAIGNEMKVVDEEDREVANGELGEIVLRGENILKGYY